MPWISLVGIWIFLSAIAAMPLAAQTNHDPKAVERGKGAFAASCGFCHGAQATGTEQAPSLVRSRLVRQDQNGEVLGPMIRAGRPALGMPSFAALPPNQILDIIAFLHARAMESRGPVVPESAMLVGNAKAGQAFFVGTGKCSTCHSPSGDLAGIGAKLTPMVLTTMFLTPPAKEQQVKVALPSGEMVSGKLEYLDEFTVSLYDGSGTFRSFSRDLVRSVNVIDPLAAHKELLAKYTDDDIHNLLAYLATLK